MLEKLPVINNYWFIGLITILGFMLTVVTSKGGLTNNTFTRRWWRRYTKRFWQALTIGVITFSVLLIQEKNNQNASDLKDEKIKQEQDSRAIAISKGINKGVKKSSDKLFEDLSLAFKKQGLQFDTIRNEVKRVRDSVKVVKNYGDLPLIAVRNLIIFDSINFDKTYQVKYEIMSHDAQSLNLNLMLDVFAYSYNSNIFTIGRNHKITYKGQSLAKGYFFTGFLNMPKEASIYSKYFFRLKGSYNSNYDNKELKVDKIYVLTPRDKKNSFGNPLPDQEDYLRNYIKQRKLD